MPRERLGKNDSEELIWRNVISEVQVSHIVWDDVGEVHQNDFFTKPEQSPFLVLFGLDGSLTLEQGQKQTVFGVRDIMLLPDNSLLTKIEADIPFEGILVGVDTQKMWGQQNLSRSVWGDSAQDMEELFHLTVECHGCLLLRNSIWSRPVFMALQDLAIEEQMHYCKWKTMELLYLLCKHSRLLISMSQPVPVNSLMACRVQEMCSYMQQNLHEKITISTLCSQFYISPTSFKKYFRAIYGQPVHRWLQQQRIEKAAKLLQSSNLTVLQIAQNVGYDGLSQFNATFKQFFHCTPTQCRNASKPVTSNPIPLDIQG